MTKTELIKLINHGEDDKVEFKLSLADTNRIVEVAVSFANAKGGAIVVGVRGKKTIGVTIGKRTIERLVNKITDNTDPVLYPEIKAFTIKDRTVIAISVREGKNKPYLAFSRPFKRVGKSTVKMSRDEYERLILGKYRERLYFDSEICKEATLKDVDEGKIKKFLKEAKSERGLDIEEDTPPEEALMRLKLIRDGKLTNAAILLFVKNPQEFLEQSEAKCIRFKGNDVTCEMIDLKPISVNIIDQVKEIEKFIFNHISLWKYYTKGVL